ncbi:hypothetical protein E1301_Tti012415 [Triplophysa tibetana]|uniref:Uncharacterized protein n=1 Tax=Triplophysa tibetana TaxID=1572043 RepID=A0A5A9PGT6_9TELE|nr:hypothetical protein E1301_Tti012415 [Triplophysa tibetana]
MKMQRGFSTGRQVLSLTRQTAVFLCIACEILGATDRLFSCGNEGEGARMCQRSHLFPAHSTVLSSKSAAAPPESASEPAAMSLGPGVPQSAAAFLEVATQSAATSPVLIFKLAKVFPAPMSMAVAVYPAPISKSAAASPKPPSAAAPLGPGDPKSTAVISEPATESVAASPMPMPESATASPTPLSLAQTWPPSFSFAPSYLSPGWFPFLPVISSLATQSRA